MNSLLANPHGLQGASKVGKLRALGLSSALALIAMVVYVLLRQDSTHQYDIYWMLPRLRDGLTDYPRHPFALPFAGWMIEALDGFGSLHDRFKMANGICVGLAVGLMTHAATILLGNLRMAAITGLTYAALPVTVRFATLAELHGLFLPFAAIAILQACRMISAPRSARWWSAAVLGLLTAVAAGFHATGHLLVGFVGVWIALEWWGDKQPTSKVLISSLLSVVAHLVGSILIANWVLASGDTAPVDAQLGLFSYQPHTTDGMLDVLLAELIWPLMPVSILWPIALLRSPRLQAMVFALCLPAYLATCQVLLCVPNLGYTFHEAGAYLMPLAFLGVVLSVRMLPRRWLFLLPMFALVASGFALTSPERESPDHSFGEVAATFLEDGDQRLVVGGFAEYEGAFEVLIEKVACDSARDRLLFMDLYLFEARLNPHVTAQDLALYFHPQVAKMTSVMTEQAILRMREAGGLYAECVDQVMPEVYEFKAVQVQGDDGSVMSGFELRPRN